MKPVFKGLFSPELDSYRQLPEDPDDCCIFVCVDLGSVEANDAADQFDFHVRTLSHRDDPPWITPPEWESRTLYVERFSWEIVEAKVRKLCDSISGETWEEVASKLAPYLSWEFEGYREQPG